METSFCELKGKEVINVVDGKRLGKIIDIVFDTRFGKVLGIVVPSYNKSWNIFKSNDDIFIPFNCICKFGEDAILVQIYIPNQTCSNKKSGYFTVPKNNCGYNTRCSNINSLTMDTFNKNAEKTAKVNNVDYNDTIPAGKQQSTNFGEQLNETIYQSNPAEDNYTNIGNNYNHSTISNFDITPPPLYPNLQQEK